MKPAVARDPAWIGILGRIYAGALYLYPPAHRRRWGADMRRVFRDRCREAHRNGHGPARILLAELLPDLATTLGVEHFDAIHQETHPMKRLLFVLIAMFVATLALHSQVTPALDAIHHWNNHRIAVNENRAYSDYLATAAASQAAQPDPHAQIIAGLLYHQAAQGRSPLEGDVPMATAIGAGQAAALQKKADAAFAKALASDDPQALWLAVRACPARAAVCQADSALEKLERQTPDNALVWALDLAVAQSRHDPVRARTALAKMAQAHRVVTYDASLVHGVLAAFDRHPVAPAMVPDVSSNRADPAAALAWWVTEYSSNLLDEYRELKPFSDYCRTTDPSAHAQRRADCRAAGRVLVDAADLYFGYYAWMRNADPGELATAREAFREHAWRAWGASQQQVARVELTAPGWRTYWQNAKNDTDDNRRMAAALHVPAPAPASFQLTQAQYDPWY